MKYLFLILFSFSILNVIAQDKADSTLAIGDSLIVNGEVYMKAKPIVIDTLSYSEEYRRDKWRSYMGVRGAISRGKYLIDEGLVDQVSSTGIPVLGPNGKVVKNNFTNNNTFSTGFSGAIFARFIRGSFYLQPEIVYSQKTGKIDLLNTDGSLYKRINGSFSSIDIPLLVGIRFRDARIFFGPTTNFAYKMNKELKTELGKFTSSQNLDHTFFDRPNLNFTMGLGFEFGVFFFDVRFEKGLNTYVDKTIGPVNSPKIFNLFADSLHFSIGFLNKK